MSSTPQAQANTKAARLAEAIEDFMCGQATKAVHMAMHPGQPVSAQMAQFIEDAHGELRDALGEFLAPIVRLVNGGQGYDPAIPMADRPFCQQCKRHYKCGDLTCQHWRAALRANVEKHSGS